MCNPCLITNNDWWLLQFPSRFLEISLLLHAADIYRSAYLQKGFYHYRSVVNVQAMVFGNMGDTSATGVCFSRDAATGEDLFNGEYLINAQGEDVVS